MKYLIAAVLLAAAGVACADSVTIYRYRDADGKSHYSDKPIPGGKLIETFQYAIPVSTTPPPDTSKSDAAAETRIRRYLASLEAAWAEVQASERALAAAEARRAAGVAPEEGETRMLTGPATPAPTSAGGPMTPALPSAGGPVVVTPAPGDVVTGPRRGGGLRPEYVARQAALEADVDAARRRNEAAWRRYNQLR